MNRIQSAVINKLLDKYETSKTFQGENRRLQNFTLDIGACFPRYNDDAEYDFFIEINDALKELEERNLIQIKYRKNGMIHLVLMNLQELDACYSYVSRKPRSEEHAGLFAFWEKLEKEDLPEPIQSYIAEQKKKLAQNKNVAFYDGNLSGYQDVLKAGIEALKNEEEIFVRDFSIRMFGDSKRMEQIRAKVSSLLYGYGDFEDREAVLEECGIVSTPTYVMVKGNVKLSISGQTLDLSRMNGDLSFSTVSLKELDYVEVMGNRIVTIENLTSFHDYGRKEDCAIYLGGFHNKTKRRFLQFIYEQNKDKEYRHFGDMDAGGFYILEHLKRRTGIDFRSLSMDEDTLLSHLSETKKLTKSDKSRLERLRDEQLQKKKKGLLSEDYIGVLEKMLELGCKLEQEVVKEWGNSQGIRLSKDILKSAGISINEVLDVTVANGVITLAKPFRHKTLEERSAEFGGKLMLDGEYDWGKPMGREVW